MVNKNRLLRLTEKLISINSENPPGDESRIARFVKDYLGGFGVKARLYSCKKKRANVIAQLKGKSAHTLLVTPHLDTVPAGKSWRHDPFQAHREKNRLYGLGATDCKGNLACAIEALQSLVEDKVTLPYTLLFAATADEESGSFLGLVPLLEKGIIKPDAALVLDSDEFEIVVTQKGLLHLKVKVEGKRAHGAYPWRGVNAIDIALEIIKEIKAKRFVHGKNKYLRPPTLNVGTISGGDKVNVVADWCEFELDFRFLPGMSAQDFIKELKKVSAACAKKFFLQAGLRPKAVRLEIEGIQEPYYIGEGHPLVVHLKHALRTVKVNPAIKGSEGATVITFFQHRAIPAIATGFGSQDCAHVADEYVAIDNLYKGAVALVEFLTQYRSSSFAS